MWRFFGHVMLIVQQWRIMGRLPEAITARLISDLDIGSDIHTSGSLLLKYSRSSCWLDSLINSP